MNKHHKRPQGPSPSFGPRNHDRTHTQTQTSLKPRPIPSTAYIQAHEAQLTYGQDLRADDLYAEDGGGKGLMRWQGDGDEREIWTDRHDIIHLLTDLPTASTSTSRGAPSPTPSSSSSWASLPSDLEETFHLSDPAEIEEYERVKRIKRIEMLREARLREREEEDKGLEDVDGKGKGKALWPENEIPSPDILKLMSHTATALYASPNPQILESRILTNHAQDPRFEFLRGRWKDTWLGIKKDAKAKKDLTSGRSEREKKAVGGLIGGYESDSDSDSDAGPGRDVDGGDDPPPPPPSSPPGPPPVDIPPPPSDDADEEVSEIPQGAPSTAETEAEKKRLRRLKAEEWKRKRAVTKG